MKRQVVGQQGEVKIFRLDSAPSDFESLSEMTDRTPTGLPIISHSESGHHHVLDRPDIKVRERTDDVPPGMRILYAIVESPTELRQNANVPHETIGLADGIYEFRIAREYDTFAEQARRVAD